MKLRYSLDHVRVERDGLVLSDRLYKDEQYIEECFSRQGHRCPHLQYPTREKIRLDRECIEWTFGINQLCDSVMTVSELKGLREVVAVGRSIDLLNIDQLLTEKEQIKLGREEIRRSQTYVDGE